MNFNPTNFGDSAQTKHGLERFGSTYITKPGQKHIVEKPGEKGPTTIRIFPMVDANGNILPMRNEQLPGKGLADNDFYAWIVNLPLVDFAGVNGKFTAFTCVAGQNPLTFKGPLELFLRTMNTALKNNALQFPPEWRGWRKEKNDSGPRGESSPIPFPDIRGLVQGAIYENQGKAFTNKVNGMPEPQQPSLLLLKSTAVGALCTLANSRHQVMQGTEVVDVTQGTPDQVFKYNRMIDPDYGYAVKFKFRPANATPGMLSGYDAEPDIDPYARDPHTGQQKPGIRVIPFDHNTIKQNWVQWGDLLLFLTEQEQVNLLCTHYPAEAVDYALRTTPFYDLVPAAVKGKWDSIGKNVVAGGAWPTAPQAPAMAPGAQAPLPQMPAVSAPAGQPPIPAGWVPAPGCRFAFVNNNWIQEPIPAPVAPVAPPPPPAAPAMPPPPPAGYVPQPPAPSAAPAAPQPHWSQPTVPAGQFPPVNTMPAAPAAPVLPPPPPVVPPVMPPPPVAGAQAPAAPNAAAEAMRQRLAAASAAAAAAQQATQQ